MTDIVERLRETGSDLADDAADEIERLENKNTLLSVTLEAERVDTMELASEIERLLAECEAWRECAQYDPKMEGPAFKGWNRSALDRCRKQYIEMKLRAEAEEDQPRHNPDAFHIDGW